MQLLSPTPLTAKQAQALAGGAKFTEIGRSGLKRFSGQIYDEFLSSLRGIQGVRVYREMEDNDPIVGACLFAIQQVIRQARWIVDPVSHTDLNDLKNAEFLGSCLNDMSHSWNDHISEALSFLPYGWAYHETVFKLRKGYNQNSTLNSAHDDGLVGWRKLPLRMQSSLSSWEFDEVGDIVAMTQQPPPDYTERTIPIDKAILYRTSVRGNNPEGRSILRNAYRPWFIKKSIEMIEAIGIERDLVGLPVITPPEGFDITSEENKSVMAGVDKLISSLRRDEQEGICLPFGWTITLLTIGGGRRQFDTNITINRWDKRVAISMLAQFIMLGMDRVGSFALSSNQNDLFMMSVQGILDSIADTLNAFAVPKLFLINPRLHITNGKYPKLLPTRVSVPSLTELAAYINSLVKPGLLPLNDARLQRELLNIGRLYETTNRQQGEVFKPETVKLQPVPDPAAVTSKPAGEPKPNTSTSTSTSA